jgi:class 3 adenylate cyclase
MQCANCGSDASEGARFCGCCGEPIALECGNCQARNPLGFRYCAECGKPLDATLLESQQRPSPREPASLRSRARVRTVRMPDIRTKIIATSTSLRRHRSLERRHLTIMFCDLLGSTELSTQVDPEEMRQVVRRYQNYCVHQVRRFGGHVAQFLGDGIVVCFGYPLAHEDDPERAVRASLSILEQLPSLNARLAHTIQVRIGIHTGIVVVGENELFGETPNLARESKRWRGPMVSR